MYKFILLLFFYAATIHTSSAQGVGTSLDHVLQGSFAEFFNIQEQSRAPLPLGKQQLHYKTGGFQEYIDLTFVIDEQQQLQSAHLEVRYEFIKEKGMLAIDVLKSFIAGFCQEHDQAICGTLSDRLWKQEGEVAPELSGVMQLLGGQKKWDSSPLTACVLNTAAKDSTLEFSYYFKNWEEQSIPSSHFLTQKDLRKYKLKMTQQEPTFQIWTNAKKGNAVSRLVDGRWHFKTEKEADQYFQTHQLPQSEGMALLPDFKGKLGDECWVYETGPAQIDMMATLGIELTDEYYCFLVRKGASIAKIFVIVTPKASLQTATAIAKKAVQKLP